MMPRLSPPACRRLLPDRPGPDAAGLTRAECSALAAAAQRLRGGGGWFTREREDRGRLIALVLPRDEHDRRLPLFLVWRNARGLLHLCMGRGGNEATDLGPFAGIDEVAAAVEREVRRHLDAQPVPASVR